MHNPRKPQPRTPEAIAAALDDQLAARIRNLEKVAAMRSQTIAALRDSSETADQKVNAAVNHFEQTLARVIPGFELAPSTFGVHPQFLPEPPAQTMSAEALSISEMVGRNGFCPSCTSTNVRRANRQGCFEEFLRLFWIAPFRCRSCRHKFYRF